MGKREAFQTFYSSGRVGGINFLNDELNGEEIQWYENGQLK